MGYSVVCPFNTKALVIPSSETALKVIWIIRRKKLIHARETAACHAPVHPGGKAEFMSGEIQQQGKSVTACIPADLEAGSVSRLYRGSGLGIKGQKILCPGSAWRQVVGKLLVES